MKKGKVILAIGLCAFLIVFFKLQNHYYSSWILTAGWNDILYSEMDKWIFRNEKVYTFSDSGVLEEIDKEQLEVPMLWEIENCEMSRIQ